KPPGSSTAVGTALPPPWWVGNPRFEHHSTHSDGDRNCISLSILRGLTDGRSLAAARGGYHELCGQERSDLAEARGRQGQRLVRRRHAIAVPQLAQGRRRRNRQCRLRRLQSPLAKIREGR